RFDVYVFSAGETWNENFLRLARADVGWRDVSRARDDEIALAIAGCGIDVLVELDGHRADSRLAVCRGMPATIHLRYLGTPGTSGLDEVRYRLTDSVVDPPSEGDRYSTERVLRLPGCGWCYQPASAFAPIGRRAGPPTFAAFVPPRKLQPKILETWA